MVDLRFLVVQPERRRGIDLDFAGREWKMRRVEIKRVVSRPEEELTVESDTGLNAGCKSNRVAMRNARLKVILWQGSRLLVEKRGKTPPVPLVVGWLVTWKGTKSSVLFLTRTTST